MSSEISGIINNIDTSGFEIGDKVGYCTENDTMFIFSKDQVLLKDGYDDIEKKKQEAIKNKDYVKASRYRDFQRKLKEGIK